MARQAKINDLYRGGKNRTFIQDGIVRSDAYARRVPYENEQGEIKGDMSGLSIGFATEESPSEFKDRVGGLSKQGVIGIPIDAVKSLGLTIEQSGRSRHGNIQGVPFVEYSKVIQHGEVNKVHAEYLQIKLANASDVLTMEDVAT